MVANLTLAVRAEEGNTVGISRGCGWFDKPPTFYYNSKSVQLNVPNGHNRVIVRCDRKKQEVRICLLPTGWRRILERIYNWFTRRYADIPLAEVECRDGIVTADDVQDARPFVENRGAEDG